MPTDIISSSEGLSDSDRFVHNMSVHESPQSAAVLGSTAVQQKENQQGNDKECTQHHRKSQAGSGKVRMEYVMTACDSSAVLLDNTDEKLQEESDTAYSSVESIQYSLSSRERCDVHFQIEDFGIEMSEVLQLQHEEPTPTFYYQRVLLECDSSASFVMTELSSDNDGCSLQLDGNESTDTACQTMLPWRRNDEDAVIVDYDIKFEGPTEPWYKIAMEIFLPFLLAGFGCLMAGYVLGIVQVCSLANSFYGTPSFLTFYR